MSENVGSIEYYVDADTRGLLRAEKRVDKSTRNMERGFDRVDESSRRLERGLGRLSAVASAVITTIATRQIIAYADAFTNVQNRLKIVTDSSEQLAEVTERVSNIARESRANLESTAVLYSRTARATEELGISQERLLAITSTITKSFTLSGATAVEASNAIRQLSQGLASGALRGEEFNSVAEQAPEILRAVAIETGMAVGELREFAAEGGITAELLIRSIENYADTVDREFAKTSATFSQSMEVARTNAIEFVGSMDSITGAVGGLGSAVVLASENLDTISDIVGTMIVLIGGKLVGALAASTKATIAKAAANAKLIASELAAAKVANQRAIYEVAAGKRSLALATNDTLRQGAINRLAAANQTLIASQMRLNAAMAAGTVASRALTGAMSLIGGPVGVVALTAFGIYKLSDSYRENRKAMEENRLAMLDYAKANALLTDSQDAYNKSIDAAYKPVKAYADAQKEAFRQQLEGSSMAEYQKAIDDSTNRLERAQATLERYSSMQSVSAARMQFARDMVKKYSDQIAVLKDIFPELTTSEEQAAKSLADVTQSINDQLFALREGQQEYDIMIAQRKAGVEASSNEGKEIARLIRLRDSEAESIRKQKQAEQEAKDAREDALSSYNELLEKTQQSIATMNDSDASFEMYIENMRKNAVAAGQNADELERLLRAERQLKLEQQAQANLDRITQEVQLLELKRNLTSEQYELETAIMALGDEATPEQVDELTQQIERMQQLRQEAQLTGQSIDEAFRGVGMGALDSFSSGLAEALVQGDSVRGMLSNLASTIATQLLGSVIRYWAGQAAAAALGIGSATAASNAAAAQSAAAWSTAATLASIATLGGASAIGTAALGGAIATGQALSAVNAVPLGSGRLYGGNVDGGKLYPVTENGRPEMLTSGNKNYLMSPSGGTVTSNKDLMLGGGGTTTVNVHNYSGEKINVQTNETNDGNFANKVIEVFVGDMYKRGRTHKAATDTLTASNRTGGR